MMTAGTEMPLKVRYYYEIVIKMPSHFSFLRAFLAILYMLNVMKEKSRFSDIIYVEEKI